MTTTIAPDIQPKQQCLSACKNIAQGATFIIASGVSAKNFPLIEFQHTPMIVVNGAISMFLGTSISPYFYTCTDPGFLDQQTELVSAAMQLSQRVVLREDYVSHNVPTPSGEFYIIKKASKPTWKDLFSKESTSLVRLSKSSRSRKSSIGFSKNLGDGYFDARTIVYVALQIAFHAGFNTVFLVGVDLRPETGRFYETAGSLKSPCFLDQHFHSRILPSFELMANKILGKNFRVFNLSSNSKLPEQIIPYLSIDEVKALISPQSAST